MKPFTVKLFFRTHYHRQKGSTEIEILFIIGNQVSENRSLVTPMVDDFCCYVLQSTGVKLMALNQVTLPTNDMDKIIEFYRRMGFLQIVDTPHYARFACTEGNATFSLSLNESGGENVSVIYFEHNNLDELVSTLKMKGIEFDQDPTDMRYLWREAILHDPSCNKIKLYWAGENRLNSPWRVEREV